MDRRSWLRYSASCAAAGWLRPALGAPEASLELPPDARLLSDLPLVRTPTLSPELARAAQRLLVAARPAAGAALVAHVQSGNLLAFEQYTTRGGSTTPLLTPVPAASVFKLITTTALFEHGGVNPKQRVCFAGGEHAIERAHLEPISGPGSRCAPFFYALGFSRNSVYAQLVTQYLPRSALLETAERFGFNAPLPFDQSATVGTLELPYNDLAYARAAAGFQGNLLSPLGAAHIGLAIARGGEPLRLRLDTTADTSAPIALPRIMSRSSAWRLSRMMEVTIHSGTCRQVFSTETGGSYLGGISVAGKTGTLRPDRDATTSWFVGFAPSRKPEICVAIMLQNGPVWRRKASEVARDLLRYYFAGRSGVTNPFEPARSSLAAGA